MLHLLLRSRRIIIFRLWYCQNQTKRILTVTVTMFNDCYEPQVWLHPQILSPRVYKQGCLLNNRIFQSIMFPLFHLSSREQAAQNWLYRTGNSTGVFTHATPAHEGPPNILNVSFGIYFTSGVGHLYRYCIVTYQGLTGGLVFLKEFSVL